MREIWMAILLTVVIVGGVLLFPWAEKYGPPAASVTSNSTLTARSVAAVISRSIAGRTRRGMKPALRNKSLWEVPV